MQFVKPHGVGQFRWRFMTEGMERAARVAWQMGEVVGGQFRVGVGHVDPRAVDAPGRDQCAGHVGSDLAGESYALAARDEPVRRSPVDGQEIELLAPTAEVEWFVIDAAERAPKRFGAVACLGVGIAWRIDHQDHQRGGVQAA
ncbi:MAG: hypothetical protein OXG51_01710 [Gammaproteobacteria bacterium]|nr:hypothetical protein [Gammaproteobacteria bacterium]